MDITEIRSRTNSVRATKEAQEDAMFETSRMRKWLDSEIKRAADCGEDHIGPNWYYMCGVLYRSRYDGPSIDAAVRYYQNKGFNASIQHWCSPNGDGNTGLVIHW